MIRVTEEIAALIRKQAAACGLDPAIVYGVIIRESSGDTDAVRTELAFYERYTKPMNFSDTEEICRAMSWGLMQVMGEVARELGYKGKYLSTLCRVPDLGIEYGCKHLTAKTKRYGLRQGLSAYNAGSPTIKNAAYVNEILEFAKEWQ